MYFFGKSKNNKSKKKENANFETGMLPINPRTNRNRESPLPQQTKTHQVQMSKQTLGSHTQEWLSQYCHQNIPAPKTQHQPITFQTKCPSNTLTVPQPQHHPAFVNINGQLYSKVPPELYGKIPVSHQKSNSQPESIYCPPSDLSTSSNYSSLSNFSYKSTSKNGMLPERNGRLNTKAIAKSLKEAELASKSMSQLEKARPKSASPFSQVHSRIPAKIKSNVHEKSASKRFLTNRIDQRVQSLPSSNMGSNERMYEK